MTDRHFNHGPTFYPNINIARLEEIKNAKFVCELALRGKYGWTETPAQIYYQENPPAGYSNHFAIIYQGDKLFITSAESVIHIPIEGVETESGEIIYSRYRHDFRSASTANISVDGGLDYLRLVGDLDKVKKVTLTIKKDQLVVVEDDEQIQRLIKNKRNKFTT